MSHNFDSYAHHHAKTLTKITVISGYNTSKINGFFVKVIFLLLTALGLQA